MTLQSTTISVVIPSYNHGHLIARAIRSVLSQDWPAIEILIVDNHSQDNTDEVVLAFSDQRIRLIKIHNEGVIAKSRNEGIRAATGQWVAFLDSDDWWAKGKLAACAADFDASDLIYHDLQIVDGTGAAISGRRFRRRQLRSPVRRDLLVNGNPIATSSVMVRRAILDQVGPFDERREVIAAEDYDLWLRVAGVTERFKYLPATLGFYLLSAQSMSRRDMSLPMREVISRHLVDYDKATLARIDANPAYAAGRFAMKCGDRARAWDQLLRALRWGRADIRMRALASLLQLTLKRQAPGPV